MKQGRMVLPSLMNLLSPVDLTIRGNIKNSILSLVWSANREELEEMSIQDGLLRLPNGATPQTLLSALIFDFRKSYRFFLHDQKYPNLPRSEHSCLHCRTCVSCSPVPHFSDFCDWEDPSRGARRGIHRFCERKTMKEGVKKGQLRASNRGRSVHSLWVQLYGDLGVDWWIGRKWSGGEWCRNENRSRGGSNSPIVFIGRCFIRNCVDYWNGWEIASWVTRSSHRLSVWSVSLWSSGMEIAVSITRSRESHEIDADIALSWHARRLSARCELLCGSNEKEWVDREFILRIIAFIIGLRLTCLFIFLIISSRFQYPFSLFYIITSSSSSHLLCFFFLLLFCFLHFYPASWIDAAHQNSVPILGTIILEGQTESILQQLLTGPDGSSQRQPTYQIELLLFIDLILSLQIDWLFFAQSAISMDILSISKSPRFLPLWFVCWSSF